MKQTILLNILFIAIGFLVGYITTSRNISDKYTADILMHDGPIIDMHQTMGHMMSSLEGKQGEALEKAFLDEMIVHHEGAIDMAEVLLSGTTRPELVNLANTIISTQSSEIDMMKQWRMDWFGSQE